VGADRGKNWGEGKKRTTSWDLENRRKRPGIFNPREGPEGPLTQPEGERGERRAYQKKERRERTGEEKKLKGEMMPFFAGVKRRGKT